MSNESYIREIQQRLRNRGIRVSRDVMRSVLDVRYRDGRPKWEVTYLFREVPTRTRAEHSADYPVHKGVVIR